MGGMISIKGFFPPKTSYMYVCNMYVLCIRNACSYCMCVHVCARVFVTSRDENMLNFEEQYEIIFGNCRLSKQLCS